MLKKLDKTMLLILALAFLVRIVGVSHGFPFIFHPDEPALVRSALSIRFFANPKHFDWPHLHFYLNYFIYMGFIHARAIAQNLGTKDFLMGLLPILWRDPLVFYLISRILNALLGTFTIIPIYLAGKNLYGKKAGLFSALIFSFMPFHVYSSHFALIDVPAVFWLSLVIYFSSRILEKNNINNYMIAGFFSGLSASTKYHGGLAFLAVLCAHFIRIYRQENKKFLCFRNIYPIFLSGLFLLFGFILGTPYSVLDFDTFIRTDGPAGALWQFKNVGSVNFFERISNFLKILTFFFLSDFGYVPIILFTSFTIFSIFKRHTSFYKSLFLLIPSLFYFFYLSGFSKIRSHYFLIAYPYVALICGYIIIRVCNIFKHIRLLKYFFLIIAFGIPIYFSTYNVYLLSVKDTRNILFEWMEKNVKEGDLLVYDDSSVLQVMQKFSKNKTTKKWDFDDVKGKEGFYIITDKLAKENEACLFGFCCSCKEALKISDFHKRGPNIVVYYFNFINEQK